jgi:hypothetical protein
LKKSVKDILNNKKADRETLPKRRTGEMCPQQFMFIVFFALFLFGTEFSKAHNYLLALRQSFCLPRVPISHSTIANAQTSLLPVNGAF